jgi:hypothetical protein
MAVQCFGNKKDGKRCTKKTNSPTGYCTLHTPPLVLNLLPSDLHPSASGLRIAALNADHTNRSRHLSTKESLSYQVAEWIVKHRVDVVALSEFAPSTNSDSYVRAFFLFALPPSKVGIKVIFRNFFLRKVYSPSASSLSLPSSPLPLPLPSFRRIKW